MFSRLFYAPTMCHLQPAAEPVA